MIHTAFSIHCVSVECNSFFLLNAIKQVLLNLTKVLLLRKRAINVKINSRFAVVQKLCSYQSDFTFMLARKNWRG